MLWTSTQHLCGEPFGGPIQRGHWNTKLGRGCGDASCTFAKYSDEAVKLEKVGRPVGECFVRYGGEEEALSMSKKTRS